ncbi:unnamed protein product [Brachionus calyciflorus]|uniref:Uncharacterized protein n=1 Tax=Brachionus calyciflorus TaxID=104777 RepID=A0A813Q7E9_9BILA|nr:unnamed protein product [Brachionus calyciflorus]
MDVLELPRPVINFLRTMSKEMHRYSLCWDIYGGSESVTLTLTWKINCESTSEETNDDFPETGPIKNETKSPKSPRKIPKKLPKQFQHSKLDTLKTCSRLLSENTTSHQQRNLSACESDYKKSCDDLNPYYYMTKNENKIHQSRRIADTSNSPLYTTPATSSINCQTQQDFNSTNKTNYFTLNKKKSRGKSLESYDKNLDKKDTLERPNSKKYIINTIPISIITNNESNVNNNNDPWVRRESFENDNSSKTSNVNKSDSEKEKKLLNIIETITSTNETEFSSRSVTNTITNTSAPYYKTNYVNSGNFNVSSCNVNGINSSNSISSSSANKSKNNLNSGATINISTNSKVTFDPNLEYI